MTQSRKERRRSDTNTTGGSFLSRPVAAIGIAAVAVIAIAIVAFWALSGSGDDGDTETPDDPIEAAEENVTARTVVPDLAELGFQVTQTGEDSFVADTIEHGRAIYENPQTGEKIMVRVYVHPTLPDAEAGFAQLSDAYAHAPVGAILDNPLAGGDPDGAPAFTTGDPLPIGDQQVAYTTIQPDSQGNGVTTDVFRSDRLVAVVQVLGSAASDHADVRQHVMDEMIQRYNAATAG